MNSNELIKNVNVVSNQVIGLMKETQKEKIKKDIVHIGDELYFLKQFTELKEFVKNVEQLLRVLEVNKIDEDVKNKSILRLLSIISTEKAKVIDKYKLCEDLE